MLLLSSRKKLKDRTGLLLFLEALIVFLSVFLALGLESWRTNRANEKIANQALSNFEREVRTNLEEVQGAAAHQKELLEQLREDRRGITVNTATIMNNAWEIAQSSGAVSYLDFDIVDKASRIHELQRRYQQTAESSADIIYEANFKFIELRLEEVEDENLQNALIQLVNRLYQAELRLIENYEEFLEMIEAW